jgi:type IV secretory pathway TrbD component
MSESNRKSLIPVTIHASLVRPFTFMGGERNLVIGGGLVCAYLAFIFSLRYGIWYGIPLAGGCWFVWISLMRRMANHDPMLWQVLKRHRKYRGFYPARGRMNAKLRAYKDFK